jgi:hypothetical protein
MLMPVPLGLITAHPGLMRICTCRMPWTWPYPAMKSGWLRQLTDRLGQVATGQPLSSLSAALPSTAGSHQAGATGLTATQLRTRPSSAATSTVMMGWISPTTPKTATTSLPAAEPMQRPSSTASPSPQAMLTASNSTTRTAAGCTTTTAARR